MSKKQRDYSIFDKFNFERKPVGIKFSLRKPEGIEQIDKSLALCEFFKEAQTSRPFYATGENIQCGAFLLGMTPDSPILHSGVLGPRYGMFKDSNANRRVFDYVPSLPKDTVRYVSFSSLDQLSEDPDVIIITANTTQAEILLRASSYSSGEMWSFKGTSCLACAWLCLYPYVSGKLNLTVTGLGFSMKARQVLPEGLILISIPFDLFASMIENLQDMEWAPRWFSLGREGFIKAVDELNKEVWGEFSNK